MRDVGMKGLSETYLTKSNVKVKIYNFALVATLLCLLAFSGCFHGDSTPPSPPINFSEYYPLSKGSSFSYDVTPSGGSGPIIISQTWTNGLTYNGQASVRTCMSALEWEDEAFVNGQTVTYAFSDETGIIGTVDTPIIYGIDNWQAGQTVTSIANLSYGYDSYPIKVEVTYVGIESITVPAGTFTDSIKVNFSFYDGVLTGTSWFAKDIGLVKETYSDGQLFQLTARNTLPLLPPELLNISPTAGATDGGNLITLAGSFFQYGANITVGNKLASSTLVNSQESVTAFIPAGISGRTDVAIVNPDCQTALIEDQFDYKNVWTATSTTAAPEARTGHSAVWTGSEMIIWGGHDGNSIAKNTGARFNPVSNTWQTISTVGAPQARWGHTTVWTGTEMIVWGGYSGAFDFITLNTGAKYNPQIDTWSPVSITGAPSARFEHTAVWNGAEMIIWGGFSCSACFAPGLADGALYDPGTNTWTQMQTTNAPSARGYHSAVWTGSEMIVWGGDNDAVLTDSGGIYTPEFDSWVATNLSNAPAPRHCHVAVWTGSTMAIVGGQTTTYTACGTSSNISNTGAQYDLLTGTWETISSAPIEGVVDFNPVIWTGSELIMQGSNGFRYDPATDSWRSIWTSNASVGGAAVWTGTHMIIWGGEGFSFTSNEGGIYDPDIDPNFFSQPLPSITTISPSEGPVAGGTDITLTGSYFRPDVRVAIGGNPAVNVTVVDTNTILVTVPAGTPGYADVVVDLPDIPWWKVTETAGFTYTPYSFEGWIGGGQNGWQIGQAPESGRPGDAKFSHPSGIFIDANGNVFVGDNNNNRVQKWNSNGDYLGWIGGGENGWQTGDAPSSGIGNGQFDGVHKIHVDVYGYIYATDISNNRIQKWDSAGNMLGWIGAGVDGWQSGTVLVSGDGDGQFNQPMGVALDNTGNLYIADKENHRIQKWDGNGIYIGWIGGGIDGWQTGSAPASGNQDGSFYFPMDVAVDSNGNIYVADTWNWRIQKWDSSGNFVGWIGGGANGWQTGLAPSSDGTAFREFREVFGVSVDTEGNIYVANSGAHSVYKWNAAGNAIGWIGNGQYGWQGGEVTGTYGSTVGFFNFPWDVAVGPDGKLYIADAYNARIQKWKE